MVWWAPQPLGRRNSSHLTLKPVARIKSGPEVPEAASGRGGPRERSSLGWLGAVAALAVAGAVAGGGAGAGERGLRAALRQRWTGGDGEWGEQRGGRRLAGALEGPSASVPPPSEGAELGIQRQSAWPQTGGGGRQEREVWGRLGPAVALGAGAGAAVAVAVGSQARVWGQQTQLRAAVRAQRAPGQSRRGAGAVAREARGTGTGAAGAFWVALVKNRHPGGGGAQLAAELQLLHPPSQDVWHGAAEVIGWFNNCRREAAKPIIRLPETGLELVIQKDYYLTDLNNWFGFNLTFELGKTNLIVSFYEFKVSCLIFFSPNSSGRAGIVIMKQNQEMIWSHWKYGFRRDWYFERYPWVNMELRWDVEVFCLSGDASQS